MNQLAAVTEPIGVFTQPISVVQGRTTSWRFALAGVFASAGFASAVWAARIPEVRDALSLAPEQLSLLLLGVSVGSVSGLLIAPRLMAPLGIRNVLASAVGGLAAALLLIPIAAAGWHSVIATCAVLVLFGFCLGSTSVTMNVDATAVERLGRHALMPMMHACFSAGTVSGALFAVVGAHLGLSLLPLLAVGAALVVALGGAAVARVPGEHASVRRYSRSGVASDPATGGTLRLLLDPRLVIIGAMVLGMSFVEGTANDWLSMAAMDGHGLGATAGATVYAAFVGGMLVGRLGGGRLVDRVGHRRALLVMGSLAVLGVVAFILAPSAPFAVVASAVWGLGASLGFPVGMSLAARLPGNSTARIGIVSAFGYTASLVGPVVIGFAAAGMGLLGAFVLALFTSVVSLALAPLACRGAAAEVPAQRR